MLPSGAMGTGMKDSGKISPSRKWRAFFMSWPRSAESMNRMGTFRGTAEQTLFEIRLIHYEKQLVDKSVMDRRNS
ncbi:hypothetical protein CFR73_00560 [Novacetimonas maltaceti]|nr:hypothetical protein CFR73_00560 [Novacetimonas maltaceti]